MPPLLPDSPVEKATKEHCRRYRSWRAEVHGLRREEETAADAGLSKERRRWSRAGRGESGNLLIIIFLQLEIFLSPVYFPLMGRHAIVEELSLLGASVYTCSRNGSEIAACLDMWAARGLPVAGSVCDVSSHEQRAELMLKAASAFGNKLDILVCPLSLSLSSPRTSSQLFLSFLLRLATPARTSERQRRITLRKTSLSSPPPIWRHPFISLSSPIPFYALQAGALSFFSPPSRALRPSLPAPSPPSPKVLSRFTPPLTPLLNFGNLRFSPPQPP